MAPMIMGYGVSQRTLLDGLEPGSKVRFTIDAYSQTITDLQAISE